MKNTSIEDYQAHVAKVIKERGFDKETPHQVLALLVEEVGELSKALRKSEGMKTGKHSKEHDLEEEAADVFFMLLDFCSRMGIDLAQAFADKERKNQKRISHEKT
jgi:NTP pyrophosphatase (non-canonical NTP hydrolase)